MGVGNKVISQQRKMQQQLKKKTVPFFVRMKYKTLCREAATKAQ